MRVTFLTSAFSFLTKCQNVALLLLIIQVVLCEQLCFSQNVGLNGDCTQAVKIEPYGTVEFEYGPIGYGNIREINGPDTSLYFFEREHNTAWFTFDASTQGIMELTITPKDTSADYDFLLFLASNERFCSDVEKKSIKPIRSNISSNSSDSLSQTGLLIGAQDSFVGSGPGNNMSKTITIDRGEKYYLVLDNVYGHKAGFQLTFDYYNAMKLTGTVTDDESQKPVEGARVVWEETSGKVLAETSTDSLTGQYNFQVPIRKGGQIADYILTVSAANHLFEEQIVKASSARPPKPISVVLPRLRKGKRMVLKRIIFFGNKAIPLPSSKPSFRRLVKLMKANKSLEIRIEGHTNGCSKGHEFSAQLSLARAETVRDFLIEKGIKRARVTVKGLNYSQMLYEHGTTEQMALNRRVEIVVLN